jgi:hypothetical protein
MTFTLRDGRRYRDYHGRELMWDFARDARELRRFLPGLPVAPARCGALVRPSPTWTPPFQSTDARPHADRVRQSCKR